MQDVSGVVTLLTDFGLSDPFVGVMKGVLAQQRPAPQVIDLSHGIRPGAIAEGAFWLERSYRYFPLGTVHCAVVDPGVGSARAALCVEAEGHRFVGPDNGLLAEVMLRSTQAQARVIDVHAHGLDGASYTFHGRDVFAVIAGRLAARELAFADAGELTRHWVQSPIPPVVSEASGFVGNVVTVDHFGNLVTSLRAAEVLRGGGGPFRLQIAGRILRSVRTFADAGPSELVALVGSFGVIEIALRDGSAARLLGLAPLAPVKLLPS